ncbi:MAG: response regulator [Bacteroidetes bacterium]|nr:response regulator [Bacteroidota bacterium]
MKENESIGRTLGINSLKPQDHLCLIYNNLHEKYQWVSSYFKDGLNKKEKLIYITLPELFDKTVASLKKTGLPIDTLLRDGRLHFDLRNSPNGCSNLTFYNWLKDEMDNSLKSGYSGLRITADSDQYFRNENDLDALANQIIFLGKNMKHKPYVILCQYKRRNISADFLLQVIKMHPILILENEMYKNFYYIPAGDLMSAKAADKEMEQWINQLRDYKLYAATLRESERRLSTLIDNLPGAAYRCLNNPNWSMEYISHGIHKLSGYTPNEIIHDRSVSYNDLIHPDDRKMVWDTIQNSVTNHIAYQIIYRIIQKDGGETWIWEQGRQIGTTHDGTGILEGLLTDISEQKRIEQELTRAKEKAEESDMLKSAFLANMSHEIRTPLNGILGFTELLSQDNISREQKNRYKNIVQSSAEQLLTIINDILDLSKIDSRQLRISYDQVNLGSIVDEITEKAHFEKTRLKKGHIEFVLNIPPDCNETFLYTDSHRIKQILMNLLNNAFKFTFNGSVEFGYRINKKQKNKQGEIVFHVNDTGIGIPEELQSIIFQRFRQADQTPSRNPGGTGLGLSICKGLLDLMEGSISLKSAPGKGTSVKVTLPLTHEEEKDVIPEVINRFGDKLKGKNILIVEDNEVNRIYFREVLRDKGANLVLAENGMSAMKILNGNENIDLALVDIKLPDISGLEIIRKIKAMNLPIPVVAQTAYANADEVDKCYEAGCDAYLPKPINKGDLFIVINRLL